MSDTFLSANPTAPRALTGLLLALAGGAAFGQDAAPAAGTGLAPDRTPYYIGASQAFTRDTNVYKIPFGVSDNYSSTSLLAGFDQPISRQRLFGTARLTLNRYQSETTLNNTSYSLAAGADWATIYKLAGNVTATLDQSLAAPAANIGALVSSRNVQRNQGLSGLARWGGDATISIDGRAGYAKQTSPAGQFGSFNSTNEFGSLGVFYRPGSLLRLGVAARFDRTRTPQGLLLADGSFEANESRGRNLDLLAEYSNGNSLSGSGRLSYTRQTNSGVSGADFSGVTGSVNLGYRASGRTTFSVAASRDAGFNGARATYPNGALGPTPAPIVTPGSSATMTTGAIPYENNQVTNALSAGASYAATSKIGLNAGAHYSRARLVTSSSIATLGRPAGAGVTDRTRGASLGANYAYSRSLTFACNLTRDRREVSGAISYGYNDTTGSCSGQFIWR